MTGNNLQEPLQTLSPVLNHVIAEAVGEHFPRKRRYCDSCAFALQDISKVLEVGVSPAHNGVFQFEGRNVRSADDLVGGVHVTGGSVSLGIADFNLEEILGRSINLLEALLPWLRDRLHCGMPVECMYSVYRVNAERGGDRGEDSSYSTMQCA